MSKTRACYNCLHYEQTPMGNLVEDPMNPSHNRGFAPRCTKGLNPSLGHAPIHMPTRWEGKFEPDEMANFCDSYLWAPVGWPKLRGFAQRQLGKMPNFTTACLSEKFVGYFEKGSTERIKIERGVNLRHTEFGYVSVSTGWQPVFLLIRSERSRGSSVCLEDSDQIVGHKHKTAKRYTPC